MSKCEDISLSEEEFVCLLNCSFQQFLGSLFIGIISSLDSKIYVLFGFFRVYMKEYWIRNKAAIIQACDSDFRKL